MIRNHSMAAVPGPTVGDVNFCSPYFVHIHGYCFLQFWCPTVFISPGPCILLKFSRHDTLSYDVLKKKVLHCTHKHTHTHTHTPTQTYTYLSSQYCDYMAKYKRCKQILVTSLLSWCEHALSYPSDAHFHRSQVLDWLKSPKTDCSNPHQDFGLIEVQIWWSRIP